MCCVCIHLCVYMYMCFKLTLGKINLLRILSLDRRIRSGYLEEMENYPKLLILLIILRSTKPVTVVC